MLGEIGRGGFNKIVSLLAVGLLNPSYSLLADSSLLVDRYIDIQPSLHRVVLPSASRTKQTGFSYVSTERP